MNNGVLFLVFGVDFYDIAIETIAHSRRFTHLPFHVLTNVVGHDFDSIPNTTSKFIDIPTKENRHIKTRMIDYSPFEYTLYLDCDAVIQNKGIESVFDRLNKNSISLVVYGTWLNNKNALSYYKITMEKLNVKFPLELFYGAFVLFKKTDAAKLFFNNWHSNWINSGVRREMPALACTIKKNDGNFKLNKICIKDNIFSWKPNIEAIVQHEYGNGVKFWNKFFDCFDKKKEKNTLSPLPLSNKKTYKEMLDNVDKRKENKSKQVKKIKYKWSIGMPCYDNFIEVFFTVQALRMYHDLTDCEIIVIDNYGDDILQKFVEKDGGEIVKYHRCNNIQGVSHAKNMIFKFAKSENAICMDSHIFIRPGALNVEILNDDLYQGPCLKSNCRQYYLEWLEMWRANMWGIWADPVEKLPSEPKEIWAQGAGFFACKRDSFVGFNEKFRGFGGETGYLQTKYRKSGRKVWCHPKLIWQHLFFDQGRKLTYRIDLKDRIRNYIIGFNELGLDLAAVREHFGRGRFDIVNSTII